MSIRLDVILLLISLIGLTNAAFTFDDLSTISRFDFDSLRSHAGTGSCNGEVGDCFDNNEELEMLMENQIARRGLAAAAPEEVSVNATEDPRPARFISYSAMKANNVPCSYRGQSYYNCEHRAKANPYTRGCNYITYCARYTDLS
ncbi:protein RALF-like 4 [Impatiens glandulifera]|uniref:protein RALF-like 4 n=1 Tax=Impatiens glandulifera TaxID=253017 RepID=UPI001FB0B9E7|nr:protein RALF-like 4 [Impatiens glandulifera]